MSDEGKRLEVVDGEQAVLESLEADTARLSTSAVASATVTDLHADACALGVVTAANAATATRSCVGVLASNADAVMEQGYAGIVLSSGSVAIQQGGAELVVSAGDVRMDGAGAAVVVGRSVEITQGWVGIIASPEARVAEGVTVAFGPREAMLFGATFGAIFAAVLAFFIGRRRG